MNTSPTYEQIIAQKLEQLPVPNMADAIWARIATELDNDMPTTDGDDNPPPPSSPINTTVLKKIAPWVTALAVLIMAAIINHQREQEKASIIPSKQNQPLRTNIPEVSKEQNEPTQIVKPTITKAVAKPDKIDSATSVLTKPLPVDINKVDSQHLVLPSVALPTVGTKTPLIDTVPKKKKGVTGIGDKDYKIVTTPKDKN